VTACARADARQRLVQASATWNACVWVNACAHARRRANAISIEPVVSWRPDELLPARGLARSCCLGTVSVFRRCLAPTWLSCDMVNACALCLVQCLVLYNTYCAYGHVARHHAACQRAQMKRKSEESKDEKKTKRAKTSDTVLIIQTKEGPNCEDNDGLPSCVFQVKASEWKALGQELKKAGKAARCVEYDSSNGGHGCILQNDFMDLYENAKVIERDPCPKVLAFVGKIQNKSFLEMVHEWLEGRRLASTQDKSSDDEEDARRSVRRLFRDKSPLDSSDDEDDDRSVKRLPRDKSRGDSSDDEDDDRVVKRVRDKSRGDSSDDEI